MIRYNSEKPIRVLCCPRLNRMGASSRYRSFQFLPYLREHGFEIDVQPLLDDKYLQIRYATGRRSTIHVIPRYARRWFSFRGKLDYDLIWTEKEAFPWLPYGLEMLSLPKQVPYIVDYDDAEFHRYDSHWFAPVRFLLGNKIDGVMRRAAMVIAGNKYIADRAKLAGSERVELLPTVVDLDRYTEARPPRNRVFTVGWIGTPITAPFLQIVGDALKILNQREPVRLVTIGSGPVELPGVPVEVKPWSEETEVGHIQEFDVGIMPLTDKPSNHGKCGLKLIQYMACSCPVVGTPIGVNSEIIQHGVNGFQATSCENWVQALNTLRSDFELRKKMGHSGRKTVEQSFSLAVAAPRLAELLRLAASLNQLKGRGT
jgi:glycosyltransferase involved in cell wall biosynthesis